MTNEKPSIFDIAEVEIKFPETPDELERMVKEMRESLFCGILNLVLAKDSNYAIGLGWNPHEQSLREFMQSRMKEDDNAFPQDINPQMLGSKGDIDKILDMYSEAQIGHFLPPIVIIKDKETGKVVDFSPEMLKNKYFTTMMNVWMDKLDQI